MAKILVLDDRAPNREFMVTLLSYVGHHILEAADVETALNTVRTTHPDLVIADILMPGSDGFDFVHRIRADQTISDTVVVFYTANYLESEARTLARACGVEHIIVKPAEPEDILATVEQALETQATLPPLTPVSEFQEVHRRILLEKLTQKVNELELLNAALEQRVADRTADLADANAHLRELNAFKDNLLTMASHDLRSPLSTIRMSAEMVLEENLSEETRPFVQSIYNSANRLVDLVNNLLDVSKLEAGRVTITPTLLLASDLARQSLDGAQLRADSKRITTHLVVEPDEPLILADRTKLHQILDNLVSNALKFTHSGGSITVTVQPEPKGVCIRVADSGLGIPALHQPFVFEKFRQIHQQGTSNEHGSGLGLAIVKQLVELHGGSIDVESEEGRGSVFSVHLPIKQ